MIPAVQGRNVLYIGCVDGNPENFLKHQSFQQALCHHASSLLGVYALEEQVEQLKKAGQEAVAANVEEMDLGTTFDVVVAADNIEHLSNCGRFVEGIRRHLAPEGRFLVSTPNPLGLVRLLELLAYRSTKANVEHTGWFTAQVLDQLARRHGLRLTDGVFIDEMRRYHQIGTSGRAMGAGKKALTILVVGINRVLCPLLPQLSETFGFVLEHDETPRPEVS
jgi:SAM-dependent methyltransferase